MISRAPVHSNDQVSSRADITPVHVEDIVRLTGEVLEKEEEVNINRKGPTGNYFILGKVRLMSGNSQGMRVALV